MTRHPLTRRSLLLDAGRVTLGALVLGVAACTPDEDPPDPSGPSGAGSSTPDRPDPTTSAAPAPGDTPTATASVGWQRVDLAFVSAYVLVRDGASILVDTGVGGSADAIGDVIAQAGSRWEDLAHVILTHRHPDHAGSVAEIHDRAPDATVHVGRGDLAAVEGIVPASPVDDGDVVTRLQVVATPGHTAGHICVLDPDLGVLLAGDAINGSDQGDEVTGPNERFTEDLATARASVRTLAGLTFDTVLFGHGEPLTTAASTAVGRLADDLGA